MNHIRAVALARHTSKRVGNGFLRRRDLLSLKRESHSPCMTKPGGLGSACLSRAPSSKRRGQLRVAANVGRCHFSNSRFPTTHTSWQTQRGKGLNIAQTKQCKTKPNTATTGKRMPPEIATLGVPSDYLLPPGLRRPSLLRPVSPRARTAAPFLLCARSRIVNLRPA